MFEVSEPYERRKTILLGHNHDCDRDLKTGLSKADFIFDEYLEYHLKQILHNRTHPMPCPEAKRNTLGPFHIKCK